LACRLAPLRAIALYSASAPGNRLGRGLHSGGEIEVAPREGLGWIRTGGANLEIAIVVEPLVGIEAKQRHKRHPVLHGKRDRGNDRVGPVATGDEIHLVDVK